jgi:predicted TIM-barrel fold metal-dependent hydrolase
VSVYDCQAHWYPPGFFELCLERTSFPRCRRNDDGYLFELGPDTFVPFSGPMIDLDQLLELMRGHGIDVLVSSSEPLSVTGWQIDDAVEAARVLNEGKALAQERHPDSYIGLATLPLQDPARALDELEHSVAELGLGGVCFPSNVQGAPITSPELMPVYERIEELGVPLFLHPTASIARERLRDYGLDYVIGYMLDTSVAALNLVFSGTTRRYPDLKIVHPHLGAVLPYLAGRIDFEYKTPWAGNEELPSPPSDYLRAFWTDSVSETPGSLRMALDFYGEDRVLFGTDFPWWKPERAVEFVNGALDEDERRKVMSTNAKALFGR